MRKDLGSLATVFPMPVVVVAAYDAAGNPNMMTAAWSMICDYGKVAVFVDRTHKTMQNILETKAFTISIANLENMAVTDYAGTATGNDTPDKFTCSGLHETKSKYVNAPVIQEYPLTLECDLAEIIDTENMYAMIGRIVNTSAEEAALDGSGKVDPAKLHALIFDPFQNGYYVVGEKVGQAWEAGKLLMKEDDA